MIKHQNGKWVLFSKDGKKKLGTFNTEPQAKAREKEIRAATQESASEPKTAVEALREIARLANETQGIEEIAGDLRDTANRIESAFHAGFSPLEEPWDGPYRVKSVLADNAILGDAIVVMERKTGALLAASYTDTGEAIEFAPRAEWQPVELTYQLVGTASEADVPPRNKSKDDLSESADLTADGIAVEVARDATEADLSEAGIQDAIESGRRAPVVVDFRILNPGPGNKRDKRYYPADVLKRDIHVFEGADVFATDHKDKERNERTKVGKVLECPSRFMENGAPVAPILIYDPYQAEKARNRNDAGALNTLECSIFGKGRAKDGKVDGKQYKIVEAITEGIFLELVSKGGAGGQAESLSESDSGGSKMKGKKKEKVKETPVEEVDISEDGAGDDAETVTMLEAATVEAALAETKLPETFKTALAMAEYADDSALDKAVAQAIKEVKALTGSGQPFAQGASDAPDIEQMSEAEIEAWDLAEYNKITVQVGLQEVK